MEIIIVDENDRPIGTKDRDDRSKADIIRVSGLWLFNSKNEVLIAQRSLNKTRDPGKWGPSAAGTVEEGETYLSNIIKEAKEELGIDILESSLLPLYHGLRTTSHRYFVQMFTAKLDAPVSAFALQKDEVEQVRWISAPELFAWLAQKPDDFIASFNSNIDRLVEFLRSASGTGKMV